MLRFPKGCVISTGGSMRSVRTGDTSTAPEAAPRPGIGMALRLSADFVAGIVVGGAIGWGFDALLGTSPWGLIVFFLLGFAAGILSVMRTAGMIAKRPGLDDDPASRRFD